MRSAGPAVVPAGGRDRLWPFLDRGPRRRRLAGLRLPPERHHSTAASAWEHPARAEPLQPADLDPRLAVFASVAGQTRSTSAQNQLNRAQVSKLPGIRS